MAKPSTAAKRDRAAKAAFQIAMLWLVECGDIAFLPNQSEKSESLLRTYIQNKDSVVPAACLR